MLLSEIWIPCDCEDPTCPGYRLDDLGCHPFFVPFDRSKFDSDAPKRGKASANSIPFGVLATSSWNFEGERTDLNDLLASLWGAYLRSSGIANVSMLSVRGYSISSEVSSRAVIPIDWGNHFSNWPDEDLKLLLAKTSIHMWKFIHTCFHEVKSDTVLQKREKFSAPPWLLKIRQIFCLDDSENFELQTRQQPQWTCLTEADQGLTVAEISTQSAAILKSHLGQGQREEYWSDHSMAVKDEQLSNAVNIGVVRKLTATLSVLDENRTQNALIVPMASHVLGIGQRSIVSIAAECGRSAFNKELQRVTESRKYEDAFFMSNVRCTWAESIPDDRFEDMIGELLNAEKGVIRVRQIGSTREADDGRDFIAEWVAPHFSSILDTASEFTESMLDQVVDILVQVKIRSKGVGRSDISGIRDTIEHHECGGMLFVAFPNVTTEAPANV